MKETINVILICGISEVNITLDKHPHIHTSESEADLMCLYVDVDIRRREGCGRPHFLSEVWSTALHGGMVENGGEWGGRGEENEQQEEVVENFRLF